MAVTRNSLTELARLRTEVGLIIDAAVQANAQAWLDVWQRLSPAWQQAVTAAVDSAARTGRWPSSWQLARIPEVADAQAATNAAVTVAAAGMLLTAGNTTLTASAASGAAESLILAAQLPAAMREAKQVEWARRIPSTTAVARSARVALTTKFQPLSQDVAASAANVLVRNAGPARSDAGTLLARLSATFDQARNRVATTIRTEVVDACRAATAAAQDALSEYVADWLWICACDLHSCPACWAMHGTAHPITQAGPEGHPGCRCARYTRLKPWSKLGITGVEPAGVVPDGETRFRQLAKADQLMVMGAERLGLLNDGEITWADLSLLRSTKGWRDSYAARPLTDLRRIAGRRT